MGKERKGSEACSSTCSPRLVFQLYEFPREDFLQLPSLLEHRLNAWQPQRGLEDLGGAR